MDDSTSSLPCQEAARTEPTIGFNRSISVRHSLGQVFLQPDSIMDLAAIECSRRVEKMITSRHIHDISCARSMSGSGLPRNGRPDRLEQPGRQKFRTLSEMGTTVARWIPHPRTTPGMELWVLKRPWVILSVLLLQQPEFLSYELVLQRSCQSGSPSRDLGAPCRLLHQNHPLHQLQ